MSDKWKVPPFPKYANFAPWLNSLAKMVMDSTNRVDYKETGYFLECLTKKKEELDVSLARTPDPASKWFLPIEFYPLNIFPAFTSGTAYIFTGSLVPSFLHCALRTPFINLEDVFLTGLCATTQLGLRLTHNPSFVWRPMAVGGSHTCYFKQSVTVHGSSPEHMEEVWARTQDHHLCDSILFSAMTTVSRVIEFVRNIFRI